MLGLGCPPIEELEALAASDGAKVPRHVRKCSACQGVLALMVNREPSEPLECAEVELLLAVGGELEDVEARRVKAHLAECDGCREVASPGDESD